MRVSNRITSEIAGWRIADNTKTEKHRGEDQKAFNRSQIAKSNAGLQAAGGYGAAAAAADPTSQYKALYASPISATERAGALSATATPYTAASERAGERLGATRNSAGYGALLDELARGQSRAVGETEAGLDTTAFNRQMEALRGLQGVYGTNVGAQTNLLRPNQPVAEPGFWDNFILTAMGNANKAAAAAI